MDDRPLRARDPLSIVSTATIAFLLIDHRNGGRVLDGGLVHGMAQLEGKVGERLSMLEGFRSLAPDEGAAGTSACSFSAD